MQIELEDVDVASKIADIKNALEDLEQAANLTERPITQTSEAMSNMGRDAVNAGVDLRSLANPLGDLEAPTTGAANAFERFGETTKEATEQAARGFEEFDQVAHSAVAGVAESAEDMTGALRGFGDTAGEGMQQAAQGFGQFEESASSAFDATEGRIQDFVGSVEEMGSGVADATSAGSEGFTEFESVVAEAVSASEEEVAEFISEIGGMEGEISAATSGVGDSFEEMGVDAASGIDEVISEIGEMDSEVAGLASSTESSLSTVSAQFQDVGSSVAGVQAPIIDMSAATANAASGVQTMGAATEATSGQMGALTTETVESIGSIASLGFSVLRLEKAQNRAEKATFRAKVASEKLTKAENELTVMQSSGLATQDEIAAKTLEVANLRERSVLADDAARLSNEQLAASWTQTILNVVPGAIAAFSSLGNVKTNVGKIATALAPKIKGLGGTIGSLAKSIGPTAIASTLLGSTLGSVAVGAGVFLAAFAGILAIGKAVKDNIFGIGDAFKTALSNITFWGNEIDRIFPGVGKAVRDATDFIYDRVYGIGVAFDWFAQKIGELTGLSPEKVFAETGTAAAGATPAIQGVADATQVLAVAADGSLVPMAELNQTNLNLGATALETLRKNHQLTDSFTPLNSGMKVAGDVAIRAANFFLEQGQAAAKTAQENFDLVATHYGLQTAMRLSSQEAADLAKWLKESGTAADLVKTANNSLAEGYAESAKQLATLAAQEGIEIDLTGLRIRDKANLVGAIEQSTVAAEEERNVLVQSAGAALIYSGHQEQLATVVGLTNAQLETIIATYGKGNTITDKAAASSAAYQAELQKQADALGINITVTDANVHAAQQLVATREEETAATERVAAAFNTLNTEAIKNQATNQTIIDQIDEVVAQYDYEAIALDAVREGKEEAAAASIEEYHSLVSLATQLGYTGETRREDTIAMMEYVARTQDTADANDEALATYVSLTDAEQQHLEKLGITDELMLQVAEGTKTLTTEQIAGIAATQETTEATNEAAEAQAKHLEEMKKFSPLIQEVAKAWGIYSNAALGATEEGQRLIEGLGELQSQSDDAVSGLRKLAIAAGTPVRDAYAMSDTALVSFVMNLKDLPPVIETVVEASRKMQEEFAENWQTSFDNIKSGMSDWASTMTSAVSQVGEDMGKEMEVGLSDVKKKVKAGLAFNEQFWEELFPQDIIAAGFIKGDTIEEAIAATKDTIQDAVGEGLITEEEANRWFEPLITYMEGPLVGDSRVAFGQLIGAMPELMAGMKPALLHGIIEVGRESGPAMEANIVRPMMEALQSGLGAEGVQAVVANNMSALIEQVRAVNPEFAGALINAVIDPLTGLDRPIEEQVQRIVAIFGEIAPGFEEQVMAIDEDMDQIPDIMDKKIQTPVNEMREGFVRGFRDVQILAHTWTDAMEVEFQSMIGTMSGVGSSAEQAATTTATAWTQAGETIGSTGFQMQADLAALRDEGWKTVEGAAQDAGQVIVESMDGTQRAVFDFKNNTVTNLGAAETALNTSSGQFNTWRGDVNSATTGLETIFDPLLESVNGLTEAQWLEETAVLDKFAPLYSALEIVKDDVTTTYPNALAIGIKGWTSIIQPSLDAVHLTFGAWLDAIKNMFVTFSTRGGVGGRGGGGFTAPLIQQVSNLGREMEAGLDPALTAGENFVQDLGELFGIANLGYQFKDWQSTWQNPGGAVQAPLSRGYEALKSFLAEKIPALGPFLGKVDPSSSVAFWETTFPGHVQAGMNAAIQKTKDGLATIQGLLGKGFTLPGGGGGVATAAARPGATGGAVGGVTLPGAGAAGGAGAAPPPVPDFSAHIQAWVNYATQVGAQVNAIGQHLIRMVQGYQVTANQMLVAFKNMLANWTGHAAAVGAQVNATGQHLTRLVAGYQLMANSILIAFKNMIANWSGHASQVSSQVNATGQQLGRLASGYQLLANATLTAFNNMISNWRSHASNVGSAVNTIGGSHLSRLAQGYQLLANAVARALQNATSSWARHRSAVASAVSASVSSVGRLASATSSSMSRIVSSMNNASSAANRLRSAINSLQSRTITVTTRFRTVGRPAGGGGGVQRAAGGFSGVVMQPTRFMTGEGNRPELVQVTPLSPNASGGVKMNKSAATSGLRSRFGGISTRPTVRAGSSKTSATNPNKSADSVIIMPGGKIMIFTAGGKLREAPWLKKGGNWLDWLNKSKKTINKLRGLGGSEVLKPTIPKGRVHTTADKFRDAPISTFDVTGNRVLSRMDPLKRNAGMPGAIRGRGGKSLFDLRVAMGGALVPAARRHGFGAVPWVVKEQRFADGSYIRQFNDGSIQFGADRYKGAHAKYLKGNLRDKSIKEVKYFANGKAEVTYFNDKNVQKGVRHTNPGPFDQGPKKGKKSERYTTVAAARGWRGMVTKPTQFMVGEGGRPEYVNVKPMNGGAGGGAGGRGGRPIMVQQYITLEVDKRVIAKAIRSEVLGGIYSMS